MGPSTLKELRHDGFVGLEASPLAGDLEAMARF